MSVRQKGKIHIFQPIGNNGVSGEYISHYVDWYEREYNINEFIVYINSPGGSYFEALSIYNILSGYDCTVKIVGQAASAATFIAMSGKKVIAADNSIFHPHKAYMLTGDAGLNEDDLSKQAKYLKKISKAMVDAMIKKTGKSKKDIQSLLSRDQAMSAEEALAFGFVDEVVSGDRISKEVENYLIEDPDKILNKNNNNNKEIEMDLKVLAKLLGMDENSTEDQVKAHITTLMEGDYKATAKLLNMPDDSTKADVDAKLKSLVPKANKEETPGANSDDPIKAVNDRIDKIEKDSIKNAVLTLVNNAVGKGKIRPADKDAYIALAEKDFDKTQADLNAKADWSAAPKPINTGTPSGDDTTKETVAEHVARVKAAANLN